MKKNGQMIIITVLLVITISALCVTAWVLLRKDEVILAPDYAPHDVDQKAETMENNDEEKMSAPEGGGSVSLTYSTEAKINLSENTALIFFQNPGRSTQDLILQLAIVRESEDVVIAQSGKLPAGYQLTEMKLFEDITLSPGGYKGKLIVLCYNQENGEKAIVNQEVMINITVE